MSKDEIEFVSDPKPHDVEDEPQLLLLPLAHSKDTFDNCVILWRNSGA